MYGGNTQTFTYAKQDVMKHQKKYKDTVRDDLPHFDMRRDLKMQTFTHARIKMMTQKRQA